ncbi:HNH endonuclease [Arenimonas sp.]|uniref:HNH endonuclease n=1 Tax=Arenimonas sp. TaxID=1872635 RepID=UPI0039E6664D
MNWFLIDKHSAKQPAGKYSEWKSLLREEGREQCVYCAIKESSYGGFRNFHVEHFRPKRHFPDKEDDYFNLFYACAVCNSFKGCDWPADPVDDYSEAAYIDPSSTDLAQVIDIDERLVARPKNPAAAYMIERLYLNRPQLLLLREMVRVRAELHALREAMRPLVAGGVSGDVAGLLLDVGDLLDKLHEVSPYEPSDVRRN